MAEKRMFSVSVIDSDLFLEMPLSAQALYFHLAMRADDDGFVNNPKKIIRMVNASEDDIKILLMKSFVISFESGIVVIKHWRIHNTIRKDMYKPTVYTEEKSRISENTNKEYMLRNEPVTDTLQERNEDVTDSEQTRRIDKNRLDKNRIDKNKTDSDSIMSEFEELWRLYPKKEGKKAALSAYQRAVKAGTTKEQVEKGIKAYINHIQQNKIESRFIKQGSTYFNQEAWNDEYTATQTESYIKPEYNDVDLIALARAQGYDI